MPIHTDRSGDCTAYAGRAPTVVGTPKPCMGTCVVLLLGAALAILSFAYPLCTSGMFVIACIDRAVRAASMSPLARFVTVRPAGLPVVVPMRAHTMPATDHTATTPFAPAG